MIGNENNSQLMVEEVENITSPKTDYILGTLKTKRANRFMGHDYSEIQDPLYQLYKMEFIKDDQLLNKVISSTFKNSHKNKLYKYNQIHNMSHLGEINKSPMLYNLDKSKYDYSTVDSQHDNKQLSQSEMNSRKHIYNNIMQRKLDFKMK